MGTYLRYPPFTLPGKRDRFPTEAGGRPPPVHRPLLAPPRNYRGNNRPKIKQVRAADEFRNLSLKLPSSNKTTPQRPSTTPPYSVQYPARVLAVPHVNHHAGGGQPVDPPGQGEGAVKHSAVVEE